eukprot:9210162-Pyramimonas_sp.AAC.1
MSVSRPRGLGPWAATPRRRGFLSRMPPAERVRVTAYPRDRAPKLQTARARIWDTLAARERLDAL